MTDAVTEPGSSLELAWVAIDRVVVAALLNEIDATEATRRMQAALTKHLGVASSLLEGHHVSSGRNPEHVLLGNSPDGTATTLVVQHTAVFGSAEIDRLKQLHEVLICLSNPLQRSASLLHTLRNRLTAVHANVEFARELAREASHEDGRAPLRAEMLVALGHAKTACEEIARTLGVIESKQDR